MLSNELTIATLGIILPSDDSYAFSIFHWIFMYFLSGRNQPHLQGDKLLSVL